MYCRSCIDGLWKIMRHEGPSVLWHGVNVSVLISVPMICMYLPMYDTLLAELESKSSAPLIAGSAARAMSVVATSPLELLKTRIQAAGVGSVASSRNATNLVTPFSAALQQMRSDMKVLLLAAKCSAFYCAGSTQPACISHSAAPHESAPDTSFGAITSTPFISLL